ncbi:MAG TPA: hypothetical protein VMT87_05230 [Vicinamibacteria bacterium]|nr:hypothetical protein [Vicinamibacteria bacterium]
MSPKTRAVLIAAGGLAIYVTLCVTSMRWSACTFDEVIHLPPGWVSWTLGDHRMNPDHPPLLRRVAALPLLFMDVRMQTDDHAWQVSRPWEFGKRFLFRWNDAGRMLFWGRLSMIVWVGCALGLAVFAWTGRLAGFPAAGFALFLFVLGPDMLAHGQIVANDLGITLFLFLGVIAFERLTERVTAARVALVGLALGAGMATKFSGVALVPILGVLGLIVALRPEPLAVSPPRGPARRVDTRFAKLAVLAGCFLPIAVVAAAVVWAAYGFHSPLARDAAANAAFDWSRIQPPNPLVRAPFALLKTLQLMPDAWTYGFLHFLDHAQTRPAFLMGEHSETGWPHFFLVTFAVKTPVPLLLLGVAAAVVAWRERADWRRLAFVWGPFALYFVLALTRTINIGHRHLLPVYPFLFVAAGHAAATLWNARARRGAARAALAVLLAWYAAGTLRVHPHYLAYFNELAGGPANGYKYLVDSSLDWGQDLIGLRAYMERNAVPRVKLLYFGTADPGYYGVACDRLPGYQPPPPSTLVREVRPGDIVAVSATHLQGVYLDPAVRALADQLRARRPVAVIGHSIFVYRADFAWSLPS